MTTTIQSSMPKSEPENMGGENKQEQVSPVEEKKLELQHHLEKAVIQDNKTQFLMFEIDQEDYALDILTVREILDILPITRVPRTPAFMLGVINLRGAVVPVVDLKQRLGFDDRTFTENSCIIVVEIEGYGRKTRIFGLLVDAVQEVISMTSDMINAVSKVGSNVDTGLIKGVGNYMEKFVLIADLEKILPLNEPF